MGSLPFLRFLFLFLHHHRQLLQRLLLSPFHLSSLVLALLHLFPVLHHHHILLQSPRLSSNQESGSSNNQSQSHPIHVHRVAMEQRVTGRILLTSKNSPTPLVTLALVPSERENDTPSNEFSDVGLVKEE